MAADEHTMMTGALSPGQAGDASKTVNSSGYGLLWPMDRACEGAELRRQATDLGFVPVVPPRSNRRMPWGYDRVPCQRRNEAERLFRRLKGWHRGHTRFGKPDVMTGPWFDRRSPALGVNTI